MTRVSNGDTGSVRRAGAGHEVTVIARGAHLAASRKNGLRLILKDGSEHLARDLRATDDIRAAVDLCQYPLNSVR